jgi:hypothetical protein
MHKAAYVAVLPKVAVDKKRYHKDPDQSMTRGELYKAVWPKGPEYGVGNRIERAVHAKLDRDVWSLTGPSPNGNIQQKLEEDGSTLVLCRSALVRGLDPVEQGLFLTEDADLMIDRNLKAELDALLSRANSVQRRREMLEARNEGITGAIDKQLTQTLGRVRAALPTGNGE